METRAVNHPKERHLILLMLFYFKFSLILHLIMFNWIVLHNIIRKIDNQLYR